MSEGGSGCEALARGASGVRTVGDRVRALASVKYELAVAAGYLGSHVGFVRDILPVIAAELDRQDASDAVPAPGESKAAPLQKKGADGIWRYEPERGATLGSLDGTVNVGAVAADRLRVAEAKNAASPACPGPVRLVKSLEDVDARTRYADVARFGARYVAVTYLDDTLHLFSRADGRCVETSNDVMAGWSIHPDDLPRFQSAVSK